MTGIDRGRHFGEMTATSSDETAREELELDKLWRQRYRSGPLLRILDLVFQWHDRSRQRRHLAGLDDVALKDIGVSRGHVTHEVRKWFWEE